MKTNSAVIGTGRILPFPVNGAPARLPVRLAERLAADRAAAQVRSAGIRARIAGLARAALGNLHAWSARARGRRDLAHMGERELRDLGLSRADRWQEVRKPFWRQ